MNPIPKFYLTKFSFFIHYLSFIFPHLNISYLMSISPILIFQFLFQSIQISFSHWTTKLKDLYFIFLNSHFSIIALYYPLFFHLVLNLF